jgi:hypothetical protein
VALAQMIADKIKMKRRAFRRKYFSCKIPSLELITPLWVEMIGSEILTYYFRTLEPEVPFHFSHELLRFEFGCDSPLEGSAEI